MIRYALSCDAGHHFDSWFGDSAAFDGLRDKGLVTCPSCGSAHVAKAIMAPSVARHGDGGRRDAPALQPSPPETARTPLAAHRELRALVQAWRGKVLAETADVGDRFPREVRRMHDGDITHRDIRGEATLDEARALLEDGIMILPVPGAPDELN